MKLPDLHLFKQSFISLVITSTKLQVIKMNVKKNLVEKFAQVDIPPGVLMNYRVKNKEALTALIKSVWVKERIREKYVGVVVPEFSTYTKTLRLPNLTDTEINEALSWQLQEYLPMPVSDVVSDWKVIKRDKNEVQILVVAILKDVLFGYIDAVGDAGLYPLVVETPSLSIERITDGSDEGKLVIYVNTQEALLLLSEGAKIIASSVVTSHDLSVIVNTAVQMLNHFRSVKVDKTLIGGLGLTQDLVEFLNYNLGRTVQLIDVKVDGMLPAQVQDFLVGISLQHKEPAEPSSELTVNLLPPNWAKHYKDKHKGIQVWTLTLIASVVIWATFLTAIIVYMFLGIQVDGLEKSTAQARSQELNSVAGEVRNVNSLADNVLALTQGVVQPAVVINTVNQTIPEGVAVRDYRISYEDGEITLIGTAQSRTALLDFKNRLEEVDEFESVNVPISSLLRETDLTFEIGFVYSSLKTVKKPPVRLKL